MSYPTDLDEMSEAVVAWHVEATGVTGRATRAMGRKLLEECAEFFSNPTPEEAVDVLICVLNIAGREGWNLQQAYWQKLSKLKDRTDQVARDRDRLLCPEEAAGPKVQTVTVCSLCLRASCWQGFFMCDESRTAGTVEKTVEELRHLGLEHPSYWGELASRGADRGPYEDVEPSWSEQ